MRLVKSETEMPDCESCSEDDDTYDGNDELLQTVGSEEILVAGTQERKECRKQLIFAQMKVENNKLIEFQVDTSATCNVLRRQDGSKWCLFLEFFLYTLVQRLKAWVSASCS